MRTLILIISVLSTSFSLAGNDAGGTIFNSLSRLEGKDSVNSIHADLFRNMKGGDSGGTIIQPSSIEELIDSGFHVPEEFSFPGLPSSIIANRLIASESYVQDFNKPLQSPANVLRLNYLGQTNYSVVFNINGADAVYEMPVMDLNKYEALRAIVEQSATIGSWVSTQPSK